LTIPAAQKNAMVAGMCNVETSGGATRWGWAENIAAQFVPAHLARRFDSDHPLWRAFLPIAYRLRGDRLLVWKVGDESR
jgi:hypothetical protein